MKRELFERDKKVILSNAYAVAKKLDSALDIGLYSMDELARLLVYGCDTEDDFLNLYSQVRECMPRRQSALTAHFCRAVCAYCSERNVWREYR